MIFKSPNDAREPCHAERPLLALSLALAAVLLGCGEQVIVGREAATRSTAVAPIDSGSYGAPMPPRLDGGNEDDESDGDDDDESDGDDDDDGDDGANTDD